MTQIEVERHVVADPASVALLLSGPAIRGLWPDGEPANRATPTLREQDTVVTVETGAPLRSGVGFAVALSVVDPVCGEVRGRLLIMPAGRSPGLTVMRLVLAAAGGRAALARAHGEAFLDSLAALAQSRSSAA